MVKNLPAMRETWVQSLGWEDPLAKGKATQDESPVRKQTPLEGRSDQGMMVTVVMRPQGGERRAESLASPRDEA